ncbi:hypothetical protein D3C77_537660 [compost metagenome]
MVLHPGRAGGFTVAAGQAAIQVQLGAGGDRRAFEHLLDQVDAPAWAVQFIAQQLVGGARGGAETTVHAGAQDAFGLVGAGQLPGGFAQVGLHGLASQVRVQAARVEHPLGVKLLLEGTVVAHQLGGQRWAADRARGVAGGVAAHLGDQVADVLRRCR